MNFCVKNYMNMVILFIFGATLLSVKVVFAVSQIFNDNYHYCEDDFGIPDMKKIVFPNKLWTVAAGDFILYFSFCKSVQTVCGNRTSSCLIKKSNNQMIDLGHQFQMVDPDNYILESTKGIKCPDSDGSYTLTVNLECSDNIKPTPRLTMQEDACNFEVTMMRPNCQPKCTNLMQGAYLIDLRKFPNNVDVDSDFRKFSFSVCGFSHKCRSRSTGACEIFNDTVAPLATTESQLINFDASKNELTARGRYKVGRVIRELNILIKCDWEAEASHAKFKKAPNQGKKYRFELESSYGCVKLPQNCFVMSFDNSPYNLSSLNNLQGWHVANVPQGDVTLNICGPLNNPPNTICSNQYSQVCHRVDDTYINRGSILQRLDVAEDVVKATFVSGSRCRENTTLLYDTVIEFHCSDVEQGPIFQAFKNCTTLIRWETPHACPVYVYRGQNCGIGDKFGHRKLNGLFTQTDKSYPLAPSNGIRLAYNLCGPLHQNCDNYNNVSFCLKTDRNQEVIIGWDSRELISDNGVMTLELTGRKCLHSENQGKVTVNFVCNYEEPSPPPEIRVVQDGCMFNMSVFTPLACLSENKFFECTHNIGNITYNLSTLSNKNRNHVIRDGAVEYVLNVCGPIVTGPGALCRSNTMICLNNKTEANLKHRYTSLGGVAVPRWRDGGLIIEAPMGSYCVGDGHYKSVIHFECSQQKYPPAFLSKNFCTYNFIWRTPEACPIDCVIRDSKLESSLNLTSLEEKSMKVNLLNDATHYEFHLCRDTYKRNADGIQNELRLERTLFQANGRTHLKLALHTDPECKTDNEINTVLLEFRCNRTATTHFETEDFDNCILKMTVHSNLTCSSDKEHFAYSMKTPIHTTTTAQISFDLIHSTERPRENKCLIVSQSTGEELKLTQLGSEQIVNGMDKYLLNLDGGLNCSGLLCKNNIELLPTEACPVTSFDEDGRVMKLNYLTQQRCGYNEYFQLEVLLKCLKTISNLHTVKNVSSCIMSIEHDSSEVCSLFREKSVPSKAPLIGGIIGGLLVIVLICFIIYLVKNKRFPYIHISSRVDKASVPIYLRNCSE